MNVSFFIYLVSDFLALRFSVSSGCARKHSVSTYAAILVLLEKYFEMELFKNKIQSSKGGSETLALESYLTPPDVISTSAQFVPK